MINLDCEIFLVRPGSDSGFWGVPILGILKKISNKRFNGFIDFEYNHFPGETKLIVEIL